jgi:UDP-N-acetylmuramoyl-tripeptide--D-alanyl-D-alanine ligase
MGEKLIYKLGVPGEHMAVNSLAVLAAVKLAGADLARGALALASAQPAKGRGVREHLQIQGGELLLIDESYNANPASVRAALALLANARVGRVGRRIAVLGDMLELGDHGPALHAELFEAMDAASVDVLYAAGPLMANLWARVPAMQARRLRRDFRWHPRCASGRPQAGRRRDGQGIARQPHGSAGRGHQGSASAAR